MLLSKIISTGLDRLTRRTIKVTVRGSNDVQEPLQANPFGIDSNPIKDMVAIYSATEEKGKNVIIGYLNKNALADVGETRIFSTDAQGNLKTYVWLTKEGKIQLGGSADNAVLYSKLNQATNQPLTGFVAQMQAELLKISTGISGAGGSYVPGTLTFDLSDSKSDIVQLPSNSII